MMIKGCDFHTRYQQIAMMNDATGELTERRLDHQSGEAQTFAYDPFGNINKSGSPASFQPSYDANGNVLSDGLHQYAPDAENHPVTIDSVGLTYDALGRMVEQNRAGVYTQIVYGPGGSKMALMNGQTLQKAFVGLPGGDSAVYTASGLSYYAHTDHLGSTRLGTTPTRTVSFDVAYAPFGETYAASGTADASFTGQRSDTVPGNYDFLFRQYSTQGRWVSPDPAGLAAVDSTNPQSFNRYAYVLNNPLALTDPLGLCEGGFFITDCMCEGGDNPRCGGGGDGGGEAGDAGFDVPITCAFNYDAHSSEFNKLGRIPVLKAHMNADLHMADDLKNTGKGNLFVIFGEPDIEIIKAKNDQIQVKINGVDVFHPNTGEVRSDGAEGIACWFIDTDYNEESFFVRQAYFLGANDPYKSLKTTLKAEINEEAWATLHSDISRSFDKPKSGRIAVKVINHLGDEVMKVFKV